MVRCFEGTFELEAVRYSDTIKLRTKCHGVITHKITYCVVRRRELKVLMLYKHNAMKVDEGTEA